MPIERMPSARDALSGEAAIIAGAGGVTGLEAVKAMCYLGAGATIAELDEAKGDRAGTEINAVSGTRGRRGPPEPDRSGEGHVRAAAGPCPFRPARVEVACRSCGDRTARIVS